MNADATGSLRQAEIAAILALGTDLGVGKPFQHSLNTCLLATGIGKAMHLDDATLSDTYFASLLCFAGCTSDSSVYAGLVGDEIAIGKHFATIDRGSPAQLLGVLLRHAGEEYSALTRARMVAGLVTVGLPQMMRSAAAHREVAMGLARQIGLPPSVQEALYASYELWNGRGAPRRLKREDVPLPVRILRVAFDATAFLMLLDSDSAVAMARDRAGRTYDPVVVECFCTHASELFGSLDVSSAWDAVIAAEPGIPKTLTVDETDYALEAIANFVDIKTPFTVGHSIGVANLAGDAAIHCRLSHGDVTILRRAGLLHDLGRVAVSATLWNKPGPLSDADWEQVRLHPYYTERALSRTSALSSLAELAAMHHERIDGSGYHRRLPGAMLPPTARILAAADVYQAMTEPRPHRAALPPRAAADELRLEVRIGKLDGHAVDAVLAASGHPVRAGKREWAAGLTGREIEVLRLLARGYSNRQVAGALFISEKTVGHHVQHIYDKINCSTRAAATLFALQHNLLQAGATSAS